jgi:uncharacterized protein YdaU (DUF1376 family)
MAKDPAFLFYPNDFTVGTQFFSNEQVGIYVRILCAQHQHGHLSKSQIQRLCNGISNSDDLEEVLNKFKQDSEGKYYNERLDDEILKRRKHSDKQRENANMRWHKSGNANAMPLENENEIEIEIENKNDKKIYRKFDHLKITQAEFNLLNKDYSKDKIDSVLDSIQNYRANKKYVSLYLTAVKWLKKESKSNENKMVY